MKVPLLFLATIFNLILIVLIFKGRGYHYMLENISSKDFPLKDLYIIGFKLNDMPCFSFKKKYISALCEDAALLYGERYKNYYAHLVLAQVLTFAFLSLDLFFVSLALFYGTSNVILSVFLLLIAIFSVAYFYNGMKQKLKKRADKCMERFPDVISKLALLVSSGMILRDAWNLVANSSNEEIYNLMKDSCKYMENGESETEAIHKFGIICGLPEIKKFSSALIQSLEKGSSDLVHFLIRQSSELWEGKKQFMLQKGEIAASKLIGPIALMFVGVIIIIVAAAFAGFAQN